MGPWNGKGVDAPAGVRADKLDKTLSEGDLSPRNVMGSQWKFS